MYAQVSLDTIKLKEALKNGNNFMADGSMMMSNADIPMDQTIGPRGASKTIALKREKSPEDPLEES